MVLTTVVLADELKPSQLDQNFFLYSIPVSIEEGAMEKENPRVSVNISGYKGDSYGELSARYKDYSVSDGNIEFNGFSYRDSRDKVKPQHRRASFIIDYSEPVFDEIAKEIREKIGRKPEAARLVEYANSYIEKKSLKRGYDIASKVAATKEGDCSEHAVFLAALLRIHEFAARLVYGVVIVEEMGTTMAVGHAWVEYRHKKKWRLADAALLKTDDENELTVYGYIPIRVQENEGPGYMSEILKGLSVVHIEGVVINGPSTGPKP